MQVALIPARGGSKRIPRKNIRDFRGRPMIAWPIQTAQAACCFDRIIVSTDDAEVAQVAARYGAEVPFWRPAYLADDYATTRDVVVHAIEWLYQNGISLSAIACIYPTAVFLREQDILDGARYLDEEYIDYAITVTPFEFPVQRAVKLTENHRLEMLQPEHENTRSQDLPSIYHDAGALYWGRPEAFRTGRSFFGKKTSALLLPRDRAVDIDTPDDLRIAEALHSALFSTTADRENS